MQENCHTIQPTSLSWARLGTQLHTRLERALAPPAQATGVTHDFYEGARLATRCLGRIPDLLVGHGVPQGDERTWATHGVLGPAMRHIPQGLATLGAPVGLVALELTRLATGVYKGLVAALGGLLGAASRPDHLLAACRQAYVTWGLRSEVRSWTRTTQELLGDLFKASTTLATLPRAEALRMQFDAMHTLDERLAAVPATEPLRRQLGEAHATAVGMCETYARSIQSAIERAADRARTLCPERAWGYTLDDECYPLLAQAKHDIATATAHAEHLLATTVQPCEGARAQICARLQSTCTEFTTWASEAQQHIRTNLTKHSRRCLQRERDRGDVSGFLVSYIRSLRARQCLTLAEKRALMVETGCLSPFWEKELKRSGPQPLRLKSSVGIAL